jgi:hypothetical protein
MNNDSNKNNPKHYIPKFFDDNIKSIYGVLDPQASIERMSVLSCDIKILIELMQTNDYKKLNDLFNLDISKYYIVAMCTCVEWFARSILRSALIANPKSIDENLQNKLNIKNIIQGSKSGATIPDVIAAGTNVSSWNEFFSIVKYVSVSLFDDAQYLEKILTSSGHFDLKDGIYKHTAAPDIFYDRNEMVHEIRFHDIGHSIIRLDFDLSKFDDICDKLKETMEYIVNILCNTNKSKFRISHNQIRFIDIEDGENNYILESYLDSLEKKLEIGIRPNEDITKEWLEFRESVINLDRRLISLLNSMPELRNRYFKECYVTYPLIINGIMDSIDIIKIE